MKVGIVLGSRSQWSTMQHSAKLLAHLGIAFEARIITANKSFNQLHEYASKAQNRGLEIIIAGPTKKAYLPGIIASKTGVPVLGIQIDTPTDKKENIYNPDLNDNKDESIRMFTTGPEGAVNAALFAAGILSNKYPRIRDSLIKYRSQNVYAKASQENSRYMLNR